eukprot:m.215834 g.215834  ORF g.215834 m.215834 type:complete len:464 (+) comp28058_c0_seq1:454-1845(+)
MLASQTEDLAQQERARDALLESRTQVERDRQDETLARQSQDEILSVKELELTSEIVETAEALAAVNQHKRMTQQRLNDLIREVQSYCTEQPVTHEGPPQLDDYLTQVVKEKTDEYTARLGEMTNEIEQLRESLREYEASHGAHKQYIADNDLVLEHLNSRTEELETEASPTDVDSRASASISPPGFKPPTPTKTLMKTLKRHSETPRKAAKQDVAQSVHLAVESEVEISRLAKVVHQTSLAIKATVAKRNRLEAWSRKNALRTWVPDASVHQCTACLDEFNFFNRRHHCRVCGKIFCADCTQLRVKIAKDWRDVRCCERCMDELDELACDLNDEVIPEAPPAPAMPKCLSSACHKLSGSTCYSPSCQRYLSDAALDFEKHLRFEALLLEVKLKCGRARNSSDELFAASVRMRVPESGWGDFLFQALSNGLEATVDSGEFETFEVEHPTSSLLEGFNPCLDAHR